MGMKFLSKVLFSMGLIGFALTGCERHEFEKTKALHLEHGKGHGEAHGEDHAVETDHAKEGAAHAKEAPAAPATAAPAPAPAEQPRATGL
jgi:hypothetical protein